MRFDSKGKLVENYIPQSQHSRPNPNYIAAPYEEAGLMYEPQLDEYIKKQRERYGELIVVKIYVEGGLVQFYLKQKHFNGNSYQT